MPSLWSALSLSSSSSRKRSLKDKSKSSNDIFNNSGSSNDQKRKMTRLRKLRHVTDDEVGVNSSATAGINDRSQSLPVSPNSGSGQASGARTPHHTACSGHWSKSAVPQPLPRPEINNQLPQNDSPKDPPATSAVARFDFQFCIYFDQFNLCKLN